MKTFIISLFFLQFLCVGVALAQEPETTVEEIIAAEAVTNADLGVADTGLLPTNPLYFFKEIGRGLRRALTFDQVKKVELELKIANEKAAEANEVAAQDPDNAKGIERALLNYERAQERLRSRLEGLRETSENPNIDKLLDRVAERVIAHEKLFAELQVKHAEHKATLEDIKDGVDETIEGVAAKDTADKFRDRLEQAFENTRGSTLKHVRSIEFIDRLRESDQFSDEIKSKLDELRTKLSEEAFKAVENFEESGEEGVGRVRDALEQLPGDSLRRIHILEEIQMKSSQRLGDALKDTQENLRERLGVPDEPIPFPALTEECRGIIEFVENNLRVDKPSVDIMEKYQKCKKGLELERILDGVNVAPPIPGGSGGTTEPPDDGTETVACTLEYAPVCGVDGKTYSNLCVAEQQHKMKVAYEGECKQEMKCVAYKACNLTTKQIMEFNSCDPPLSPTWTGVLDACKTITPIPTPIPTLTPTPSVSESKLEADDAGFYPTHEIKVMKGSKVKLTFVVRTDKVYYGGLDFRSPKFNTGKVAPGDSTTVEFTADESFDFTSYWPLTGIAKAVGKVIVE